MFTKTNSGGTDYVWFYDLKSDGWSLDDKREPLLDINKLGVSPTVTMTSQDLLKNNLPDILSRWSNRNSTEKKRTRKDQSFMVPIKEIQEAYYSFNIEKYKKFEIKKETFEDPLNLMNEIKKKETEIKKEISELEKMLE